MFIATELHKGLGPLFAKEAGDVYKAFAIEKLTKRLATLEKGLGDGPYLLGEPFNVADAYAFYALRSWTRFVKKGLSPTLTTYYERLVSRPAVERALAVEGFGT